MIHGRDKETYSRTPACLRVITCKFTMLLKVEMLGALKDERIVRRKLSEKVLLSGNRKILFLSNDLHRNRIIDSYKKVYTCDRVLEESNIRLRDRPVPKNSWKLCLFNREPPVCTRAIEGIIEWLLEWGQMPGRCTFPWKSYLERNNL